MNSRNTSKIFGWGNLALLHVLVFGILLAVAEAFARAGFFQPIFVENWGVLKFGGAFWLIWLFVSIASLVEYKIGICTGWCISLVGVSGGPFAAVFFFLGWKAQEGVLDVRTPWLIFVSTMMGTLIGFFLVIIGKESERILRPLYKRLDV